MAAADAAATATAARAADQQGDDEQSGSLAQLFVAADSAIERRRCAGRAPQQQLQLRNLSLSLVACLSTHTAAPVAAAAHHPLRRTDNIFKQLDERSLTEDEEKIIQQRVRAMTQMPDVGRLVVDACGMGTPLTDTSAHGFGNTNFAGGAAAQAVGGV